MTTEPTNSNLPSRKFLWVILPPLTLVGLILMAGGWLFWWPNRFEGAEKVFVVSRGAAFEAVVDSLVAAGVVSNRTSFEHAGRLLGITRTIKVGKYHFKSGMSNLAILHDLRDGLSNYPIAVRVDEGARLLRVGSKFSRELGIDSTEFVSLSRNNDFIKSLGVDAPTLEGYLLPDTYNFYWQTREVDVLRALVESFQEFYADSLRTRQEQLGMTQYEVITLASIVEGETSVDVERATIAGVYQNRLRRRMMLQADPTIQYVIPDGPRRLMYSDLKVDSPYNTYRYSGLPPGPVNNPGRKSILAVLYPERHQYLYFVADGTGGHRFSKTYSEHQRAVRNWRKLRQEQQTKANASG
ncbi:MAG: endolytic transglycosylase MltG [Bacteroidota bacterium]